MKRAASNREIADILREISMILRAEGVAFKPQAYEIAAATVEVHAEELASLYHQCGRKCIDDLHGIGKSIASSIEELLTTGRLKYYEELKKKYPLDLLALTRIPNVGPKTAITLYRKLGVKTLRDLEQAAKTGKIATLPGFAVGSQRNILRGIQFLKQESGRLRLHEAMALAEPIVEKLRAVSGVTHCEVAGSLRRRQETIGDIDILITSSKPELAAKTFKELPHVARVLEEGPTKIAVQFTAGINGDLRILKPEAYGSALQYFTGSKEHNIAVRTLAVKKGYKLSEYGLFSAKGACPSEAGRRRESASGGKGKRRVAGKTEEEIYQKLGMTTPPPELRTASGEVEAALAHTLPRLIPYDSIRGDLQTQSDWTDGEASIEEMARAAKTAGFEYMAITDHTQALAMTNGLNEKRLLKQGKEIDALNKKLKSFRILKSTECDIKKDGALDLSDAALKTLDLVGVSVHSHFKLSEHEQTQRIIRALKHPLVNILFHPTGRIVTVREPYALDMPQIIRAAKQFHVALEVNASERLDLRDVHIRMAVEVGAKLVINTDAHHPDHFKNINLGVAQARRGWATAADVLNTKPLGAFLKAISKRS